jgi:hypothetical protein
MCGSTKHGIKECPHKAQWDAMRAANIIHSEQDRSVDDRVYSKAFEALLAQSISPVSSYSQTLATETRSNSSRTPLICWTLPYSFTTRFDLWERSGRPSSTEDKLSALLQRPPPLIPQSTPTDRHSWVTEALSTQSNPWHPKPAQQSSVYSAPPTGKHVVKAKERVYTVPEEGGPRTLVKTKAEA